VRAQITAKAVCEHGYSVRAAAPTVSRNSGTSPKRSSISHRRRPDRYVAGDSDLPCCAGADARIDLDRATTHRAASSSTRQVCMAVRASRRPASASCSAASAVRLADAVAMGSVAGRATPNGIPHVYTRAPRGSAATAQHAPAPNARPSHAPTRLGAVAGTRRLLRANAFEIGSLRSRTRSRTPFAVYSIRTLLDDAVTRGSRESARVVVERCAATASCRPIDVDGRPRATYCCLTAMPDGDHLAKLHRPRRPLFRDRRGGALRYVMRAQDLTTRTPRARRDQGLASIWGVLATDVPNWPTKFFIDACAQRGLPSMSTVRLLNATFIRSPSTKPSTRQRRIHLANAATYVPSTCRS